jgi:hypothetical protein
MFMGAFDTLPLAATVHTEQGVYFCSHGGLSPSLPKVSVAGGWWLVTGGWGHYHTF